MNKKLILGMLLLLTCILFIGCGAQEIKQDELSEKEIQGIISQVVGGEQTLREAGMQYFSELKDNRNFIRPKNLMELISNDADNIYILDIRNKEDYDKGHIQGAIHIGWVDVGKNIDMLPQDKRIVVCCYTGQSAGQVVGVLRMMGYDAIALLGGMNNGWYAEKMSVVQ